MPFLLSLPTEIQEKIFEYIIPMNQTFELLLVKRKGGELRADRGYGVCGYPAFNTSILRVHPDITLHCNDLLYGKNIFQLQIGIDIHNPTVLASPGAVRRTGQEPVLIITDRFLRKIRNCRILIITEQFYTYDFYPEGCFGMVYSCQVREVVRHIVEVLRKNIPLRSLAFQVLKHTLRRDRDRAVLRLFESGIDSIFQHVLDPFIELRASSLSFFGQSQLEEDYKTYLRAKILVGGPSRNDANVFNEAVAKYESQPQPAYRNFWNLTPSYCPVDYPRELLSSKEGTPYRLAFFEIKRIGLGTMHIALYDQNLQYDYDWLMDQVKRYEVPW